MIFHQCNVLFFSVVVFGSVSYSTKFSWSIICILASKQVVSCILLVVLCRLMLNEGWGMKDFNRQHRVFPGFLSPSINGWSIPITCSEPWRWDSCGAGRERSATLHCDEFSTDVFLLSLLLTLPVLLFSPTCLQLWCTSFLNMSSTSVFLFSSQFRCTLLESFLLVLVCKSTCAYVYLPCLSFTIPLTTKSL